MTRLGGESRLRGIITNRYIDTKMIMTQMEYRRDLTKHFGFVLFTGTGKVAYSVDKLTLKELRYAGGVGLRFSILPEQNLRFRLDYGHGIDNQSGIYVGMQEVF